WTSELKDTKELTPEIAQPHRLEAFPVDRLGRCRNAYSYPNCSSYLEPFRYFVTVLAYKNELNPLSLWTKLNLAFF
ncbi:MAG: hypothetical protein AAFY20_27350, partial [Cyanobacteria bacterium J06639_14]